MSHWFLLGAAALSAVWALVHLIAGGRGIARPLRAAQGLAAIPRDTTYLCWHLVSVTLVFMAVLFAMGALISLHYAVAGVLLSAAYALLGLTLVPLIGQRFSDLPQGWLFVPVAALGLAGVLV